MSLLIARLCPGLCRFSTPLSSIQRLGWGGGGGTAGKPNNLLPVGQSSLQVGYEAPALMRKDSSSGQAGRSKHWPIMELLGGGLCAGWGGSKHNGPRQNRC